MIQPEQLVGESGIGSRPRNAGWKARNSGKLKATSNGGMVVAIQKELGQPIMFLCLGEQPDAPQPFDAKQFVLRLLPEWRRPSPTERAAEVITMRTSKRNPQIDSKDVRKANLAFKPQVNSALGKSRSVCRVQAGHRTPKPVAEARAVLA